MISSLNEIKKGTYINYQNEPYIVVNADFLRMQARKPVMQTKLKNLVTGKILEYNFKPGERIEEADIRRKKANYLYKDESNANFMDNDNFEQFFIPLEGIEDKIKFLKDSTDVDVLYFNDKAINIDIPPKVELHVTQTEPGVRGDTAQGSVTKPATLETGITVNVPLFVKTDDLIRVNTETGDYVERV